MKRYYEKYKHIIPLAIFGVIYVLWFYLLEHRTNVQYMVVHMNIDDYIPFCEYFVVPYLLWFAYVPAVLGYLFFKDRRNYDRCAVFLCTGMLIFLVISTFIPNIQHPVSYTHLDVYKRQPMGRPAISYRSFTEKIWEP